MAQLDIPDCTYNWLIDFFNGHVFILFYLFNNKSKMKMAQKPLKWQ